MAEICWVLTTSVHLLLVFILSNWPGLSSFEDEKFEGDIPYSCVCDPVNLKLPLIK